MFCARGRLLGSAYDPQAVASEDLVQCPLPADTRACATATDLAQCTSVGVAYCLSGQSVRSLEVGHMSREGECRRSSIASLLISRITRLTQHTHSRPIPRSKRSVQLSSARALDTRSCGQPCGLGEQGPAAKARPTLAAEPGPSWPSSSRLLRLVLGCSVCPRRKP